MDDNSPGTDNTPTIISKNSPEEITSPPTPHPSFGDLRGRRLAHFELIEPIGVGGMAAVLRARDTQLDRNVALKILPPDMAVEEENVRRFHQEARAAAKLDHENIARVFFCGEDQKLHFIAFEFVEGNNLRTIIEKRGKLPVNEAVHYMLQIATGLAHAWERNVVHRDIKPSNIIITPDGRAKLVDMGLARSQEPHSGQALTQSGVTLGTFDYISPEQALEPREADVRSDIYSLGCTFYHVLTGKAPVPEGTAAKKLNHHQNVPPIDPRQLNPEIPDSVAAILARMMAKDPKNRYQRPEHLVHHLLHIAQELGMPTEVSQGMYYVDAPLPSPPQKRPGLIIGLALGGLVAALVLLSFAPPVPEPFSPPFTMPEVGQTGSSNLVPQNGVPKKVVPAPGVKPDPSIISVKSAKQLEEALNQKPSGNLNLRLKADITLTTALFVRGDRTVIIDGTPEGNQEEKAEGNQEEKAISPYKIIFAYSPSEEELLKETPSVWGGLQVETGTLKASNIRFEVMSSETPKNVLVGGVVIKNSARGFFEKCTFRQEAPEDVDFIDLKQDLLPLASVIASNFGINASLKSPVLEFQQCFFAKGQTAVALEGGASLVADNCAFGPHGAMFHLRGNGKESENQLTLGQCTGLVVNGPVFRVDDQSSCRINVTNSLFSRPAGFTTPNRVTQDLIHQTGSAEGWVYYSGNNNVYHNLNFYWVRSKSESMPNTLHDFNQELKALSLADDSFELESPRNPFNLANPLAVLADYPKLAFQLDKTITKLRPVNGKAIGVQKCVWGNTYGTGYWSIPKPNPPIIAATTDYIVDPELKGTIQGHYRTLAAAIEEAPSDGITILLKQNGQMPVNGVRLNHAGKKIILKPHPGYRPELTLKSDGSDSEAALFEIQRGQIVFEGLSILLEPDRDNFVSQAVVDLSNQGHCVFDNCVLTLKPSAKSKKAFLYGVSFSGANNVSPAETKLTNPPRIEMRDTLVRGEGIFLNFTKAGPYELESNNSLIVLIGSMIKAPINHPIKSILPSPGKITLNKTTTYLSDHLLHLTDEGTGMGLITTTVVANDCLYAAYDAYPLLQFTGLNSAIKRDQLFQWSGIHNAYCGYDTILHQQPTQSGTPLEYKSTNWMMKENMQGDPGQLTRFVNDSFDYKLLEGRSLTEIQPDDITKLVVELQKQQGEKKDGSSLVLYGANLAQLQLRLPLPAQNPVPPVTPLEEELNAEKP